MCTDMTDKHDAQAGVADAIARLSDETRELVREELDDAREELIGRAKALAPAAGLLALGAGMGLAAAASSYRLALRILERMTTPGVAAFLATAGFGAAAAVATSAGIRRLGGAPAPVPTGAAITAVRDTAETVAEATDEVRRAG